MAIPDNYIDKITKDGESRMISPAADKVRVDNEHYEGDNLDDVLDEIAEAIDEAGSGDGTVKGVKVGSTTYDPDSETGVVDLSTPIANKADKVPGKGLSTNDYTDAEKTKLQNLPTADGLTQQLSLKVNAADVPGIIEGNVSVEQPANPDGTFTIHVGDNDYTVNLNHTHEGMAKVEKHTPATLPDVEDMDDDTIYAEVEDGEVSVLYIGGVPFYGGVPSSDHVLRQPADESTIDVGKIASGSSSVTKTITVKGKNLTEALSVVVTGTGFTVDKQSIPAVDANLGTTLTITCTSTDDNAAGTLTIASNEVSCDCDLIANVPVITPLTAIKLTGSQWLQTDYCPGRNTEFDFDIGFANVPAAGTDVSAMGRVVMSCPLNTTTDTNKIFRLVINSNSRYFVFTNEESSSYNGQSQDIPAPTTDGRGVFGYRIATGHGVISFGENSHNTSLKTSTMQNPIMIGYGRTTSSAITDSIFTYCHLIIYGFVITENGETVRDYIPVTRNGVPGLHDTKTGAFISSETSTPVVAIE